jgi:protein AATF/BFR2
MAKKRTLSVFDAVQELESEDVKAESQRKKRTTTDASRAQAAQSQSKIYSHLVECRILLQRAMTGSSSNSADDNVGDQCDTLLTTLLQARQELVHPEVQKQEKQDYSAMIESSDLENDVLDKEHESCKDQWKLVLNRRHKDLRLHAGVTAKSQFKIMDSSFWQQVEATQEYEQLRKDSASPHEFDDSKVYQQMLKDFVATSAAAAAGTLSNNRLQKKAKTQKKEVDRKASKGRKIRYTEIPKLVNFTFPLSRPITSTLDQDEWFQSLFGGAGSTNR